MQAGDYVKVITSDSSFEGILLPRPEVLEQDVSVLKLDNGYNIGINNSRIKKIEVIRAYKKKKAVKNKIPINKNLKTISVLSTGGTISSSVDYTTGGVSADFTSEDFVAMCPELTNFANLKAKKVMSIMSEDITPEDWIIIAKNIISELRKSDGVVVTMGTDTLHTTAAALSYLIKDLNKPVIITGAQRSIDRGSSDAFMNLICSTISATKEFSGIYTCMHGTINDDFCILNPGTKVRKMHTSRRDAFRPMNALPFAKVFPDGKFEQLTPILQLTKEYPSLRKIVTDVSLLYIHPNISPKLVEQSGKAKGLIVAATALGHVPSQNVLPILKKVAKRIPVVICSQTLYGAVHPHVYTNLRRLSLETGAVFCHDLLPDTALSKLMVALGECKTIDEVKSFMSKTLHDDISEREIAGYFLR